jgi:hypothetical protein
MEWPFTGGTGPPLSVLSFFLCGAAASQSPKALRPCFLRRSRLLLRRGFGGTPLVARSSLVRNGGRSSQGGHSLRLLLRSILRPPPRRKARKPSGGGGAVISEIQDHVAASRSCDAKTEITVYRLSDLRIKHSGAGIQARSLTLSPAAPRFQGATAWQVPFQGASLKCRL